MRRRLAAALLLLCPALLGARAVSESPEIEVDPLSGIHRTKLENGLTVLVLPRPAAPTVAVQIWYRVGSADERDGERDLAHFLEHLLFKGTETLPKGEIDALTHRNGGKNNAFTGNDVTVYHFTFAPDRWETALRIEADRMRNTLFDETEFEAERNVVLEELKTGLDEPWDALDDAVIGAAFRVHPYHHPVIGYTADLARVTREQVRDFYRRHYTPANATLVVVGRVEADDALEAVRWAFDPVTGPPAPDVFRTPEPPQSGQRRVISRKKSASAERFQVVWHTVAASHDDDPVLDVARAMLGAGRSSRLQARLVEEEGLLTSVAVSNDTRRDPGLFWIWGELAQGTEIAKVEAAIEEEIARLRTPEGFAAEELARAKAQAEASIVFSRETSDGAAQEIGFLTLGDGWKTYGARVERTRAVTAEDVVRVAKKYLRIENRTFGLGTGPRKPAKRLEEKEGAAAGAPIELSPRRIELPNGLILLVQPKTEAPVVSVRAHVRANRLVEDRPGLSYLTGKLLLAGAGERSRREIAEVVEAAGGRLSSSGGGVTVDALARDLPLALEVVADVLRRPTFPEEEVARWKKRTISELAAEKDEPKVVARRRFQALTYGAHPYGRNPRGDEAGVKAMTREDVVRHHATWFHPNTTALAVVGDVDADAVEALVRKRFGDWKKSVIPALELPEVAWPEKVVAERIARPGRQVNVYLGHRGIRRADPDYATLKVLDNVLGWSPVFSDRLSRELREKRGLCYDTWASVTRSAGTEPGAFTAFVATSPDTADEAIAAIRAEIARIRDEPITEDELSAAKSYLTGSWVFEYETAANIAERLIEMERWAIGFDAPRKFVVAVRAVTREDVQRAAKKHVRPDRLVIVEVGPER